VSAEASNIVRRFIKLSVMLDPTQLRYLRVAARTLRPGDLRLLAREIIDAASRKPLDERNIRVIRAGEFVMPKPADAAQELRGLARSIIRYGGADMVRRDAAPVLVETLNRIAWPS
jgi:hypothetical protein